MKSLWNCNMNQSYYSLCLAWRIIPIVFLLLVQAPLQALPKEKSKNVVVELSLESNEFKAQGDNWVALQFKMAPQYHIYWKNYGEVGLATKFKFDLPEGLVLSELLWPQPERFELDGIVSYGYKKQVVFLANFKGTWPLGTELKAQVDWLECYQTCQPGKASLSWKWGALSSNSVGDVELFKSARANVPVVVKDFGTMTHQGQVLLWKGEAENLEAILNKALSEQGHRLATTDKNLKVLSRVSFFPLARGWMEDSKVQVFNMEQGRVALQLPLKDNTLTGSIQGVLRFWNDQGLALATVECEWPVSPASASAPMDNNIPQVNSLLWMLLLAFLGGLILNVMPCVLPVLSIKMMHILEHSNSGKKSHFAPALAYTLGVVCSFVALALTLIFLRKAGEGLGWGFQMQSIGVVCGLMVVFLLMGLNLFGVFEVGLSLVGVDQKAPSKGGKLTSAFASGTLATMAATPCTAPYMGAALGYALTLNTLESLSIFISLGLGMASPFLVVGLFPRCLGFLPKPGAWMLTFKQAMGFLLMGTVAYLYYVAATLVDEKDQLLNIGFALVLFSIAAWIYGQWGYGQGLKVAFSRTLALLFCIGAVFLMRPAPRYIQWLPYEESKLTQLLEQGQPVFLDFTASWCLSCKANEQRALNRADTAELFKKHGIVAMKADWSKYDPSITLALEKLGRNSVPVYALYSPASPQQPLLLPEILQFSDLEQAAAKLIPGKMSK